MNLLLWLVLILCVDMICFIINRFFFFERSKINGTNHCFSYEVYFYFNLLNCFHLFMINLITAFCYVSFNKLFFYTFTEIWVLNLNWKRKLFKVFNFSLKIDFLDLTQTSIILIFLFNLVCTENNSFKSYFTSNIEVYCPRGDLIIDKNHQKYKTAELLL